jgi:thioredoxin-dependent peroxiredoxin
MITHLNPGDLAPDFNEKNQDNKQCALADYSGSILVLFFYPHDLTPTCTVEACNLRDNYKELLSMGISVLGVSEDTAEKHQKFISKHDLTYDLIADNERTMLKAYGVWGNKKFMGREFDGTHRTTFIIGKDGKIIDVIKKVKSKIHTAQILEILHEKGAIKK